MSRRSMLDGGMTLFSQWNLAQPSATDPHLKINHFVFTTMNRNSMGKVFSGKAIWRRAQDELVGSGVDTVDKQCEGEAEEEDD